MKLCALLFHFSGCTACDVNVKKAEQEHPFLLCIYTLRTSHWQDCKLYFSLNLQHLNGAHVWSMVLSLFCSNSPSSHLLANEAGVYEHGISLYPQLCVIILCYTTSFTQADGYFPAHHPLSPLPFFSPFSPALLCTPLVSHFCFLPQHLTHHPFILPSPPFSALLMSISHS